MAARRTDRPITVRQGTPFLRCLPSGQIITTLVGFENSFSSNSLTLEFGRDNDGNPYNNTSENILFAYTNSLPAGSAYQIPIQWPLSSSHNGKYLYAKESFNTSPNGA